MSNFTIAGEHDTPVLPVFAQRRSLTEPNTGSGGERPPAIDDD